jgi:hypothetical protein
MNKKVVPAVIVVIVVAIVAAAIIYAPRITETMMRLHGIR